MAKIHDTWNRMVESSFVREADGRVAFRHPWGRRAYWIDSPEREQEIRRSFERLLLALRVFVPLILARPMFKLLDPIPRVVPWLCIALTLAYGVIGWPLELARLTKRLPPAPRPAPQIRRRSFRSTAAGISWKMTLFALAFLIALTAMLVLDAPSGQSLIFTMVAGALFLIMLLFYGAVFVTKLHMSLAGTPLSAPDREAVERTRLTWSLGRYLIRPVWFAAAAVLVLLLFNLAAHPR